MPSARAATVCPGVIQVTPEDAFYLYNGERYPWGIVHTRNRVP